MSSEENKEIVRRFFAALDRQDLQGVRALLAPDYIAHIGDSPYPMDSDGFAGFAGAFFAALPDVRHPLQEQIAEGDRVATRCTVRGTHLGSFQGIPPSNRPVTMSAINVHRVTDGKIVEQWLSFDGLSMLQQIGAFPAPERVQEAAATA